MSDMGEVTQRLEELHDAGVAANEMGELFLTDYAMETIAMAKAKLESLQRENEELKARPTNNEFYALKLTVEKQSERIRELSDAAITPEMRERIERKLADMQAESPLPIGGELVDLLRDLLGEQG